MQENKPKLHIDWASHKAAKYACEHWHYSGTIPKAKLVKIGAWENGVFIGVVIFSYGATSNLVKPYGLNMNEGCELTRVALRPHHSFVSQILARSIKLLKSADPGLRIIVSFADTNEGHHGGIYQATNWVYTGLTQGCYFYMDKKGKLWHPRNVSENLSLSGKMVKPSECKKIWKDGKHRYLMPLDKEMRRRIEPLARPYPRPVSVTGNTPGAQPGDGGSIPTAGLMNIVSE